ncbi:MAG TPA: hypothetical protein VJZ26_18730 [Blastocatellia bacterium]|nr:hypothetical protein [Blastocatellia bacterium]
MTLTLSDNLIRLNIAGIQVALEIADDARRAAIGERYREFIVSDGEPQTTIRVEVTPGAQFIPMRPGPWITEFSNRGQTLSYRSHMDAGWMDIERGEAVLEIAPEADIENFLRALYAQLCLRAGGLLLHAAGVVRAGAGFVFFGPSGSGKTTAARLSPGRTVLSDDLVILMTEGDRTLVHGVPFRGDFAEAPRVNTSADLRGLFTLVKAPEHALTGVPLPEAIARLLACAPFAMTDARNTKRAMEICSRIAESVPVRALRFRRDPGFWRVIDERKIPHTAPAGSDAKS